MVRLDYAFTVSGGNGCIHLTQVTGQICTGEQIIINEDTSFIRSIKLLELLEYKILNQFIKTHLLYLDMLLILLQILFYKG